jgi:hypothetical protein
MNQNTFCKYCHRIPSQCCCGSVKEQDESFDRTASHMAGEYVSWTSCVSCGQRVTGDSIHTCSPQLKQLTDEEIEELIWNTTDMKDFARAILRKAQER